MDHETLNRLLNDEGSALHSLINAFAVVLAHHLKAVWDGDHEGVVYQPPPGTMLKRAAQDAIQLARILDGGVVLKFNDHSVSVEPDHGVLEVENRWRAERERTHVADTETVMPAGGDS